MVFTMRSRQHVVIARLNDSEYKIYTSVLHRALEGEQLFKIKNQSQAFRAALQIIDKLLTEEARMRFYESGLDF
jgi:hypothetical protein